LNREFTAHLRKNFRWLERFDCLVFSSEVGLIKPDLEIYRHSLRALQAEAEETLFIDDREANVQAAGQLGIIALQYRSTAQLSKELQARGFDILPVII
jgi:putative hydrolase of the HAD superfamily